MGLAIITVGLMVMTVAVKWFSVTAITSKRSQLSEANELNGQAKFRLKVSVQEVTNTQAEIDKLKRKVKTSTRKISKLKGDYQKHSQKAQETAELNAEKMRLAKELKQRKGEA